MEVPEPLDLNTDVDMVDPSNTRGNNNTVLHAMLITLIRFSSLADGCQKLSMQVFRNKYHSVNGL